MAETNPETAHRTAESGHGAEERLIQQRIAKAERIRARGDEPYKYVYDRSSTLAEARARFEALEAGAAEGDQPATEPLRLGGRVTAMRDMGKSRFADLRDESGKIQLFLNKKMLGDDGFEALDDLDIGDFIGVEGEVKRTRTGEVTCFCTGWTMLTKALRPLPEKWHGLTDTETRFRQRYLDLVANPDVMGRFRTRVAIIAAMREFLTQRGFLEVETPMLHALAGGATARPFITHHNALDRDFYLRIAPELFLKRLIVGGFEKVFEINRNFRNEGIDTTHNPEFTMMELYEAWQDYEGLMDETEELFVHVIQAATGGTTFTYQGETIDAARPWKRLTLFDAIREYAGIDLEPLHGDRDAAARLAEGIGIDIDPTLGYGKIVDEVMKERVQPKLVQPTFLHDYPIEISPLAKRKRDNPALTERFQAFIGRLEMCNAFSELNDPVDQRARFEDQMRQRAAGDQEAQPLDEDFITALQVGMPPTAGLGIGIDRLVMLLTDTANIREVILFPQLRTL
jgi:lysyl-tRNA synthetase class 2